MKDTKRDLARAFINDRNFKMAFKLCRKFDLIYNKNECRILDIAYECSIGNKKFYQDLGINTAQNYKEAIDLLQRMKKHQYCINTDKLNEISKRK